jgi:AcrR family transcriptional regulator
MLHPEMEMPTPRRKGKSATRRAPLEAGDAKERILAVALQEFSAKGFEGATTSAIAKAAGVTQPLIHYYFSSKDLLWKSAVDFFVHRLRWMEGGLNEELRDLDSLAQLKVLARRLVHLACRHPELARLINQEGTQRGPRFSYMVDRLLKPMLGALESAASKAQRDGWLKQVPVEHLLFLWLGAASQLFSAPALAMEMGIDVDAPSTTQQYADAYVEVVFHGLLMQPPAAEAPTSDLDRKDLG